MVSKSLKNDILEHNTKLKWISQLLYYVAKCNTNGESTSKSVILDYINQRAVNEDRKEINPKEFEEIIKWGKAKNHLKSSSNTLALGTSGMAKDFAAVEKQMTRVRVLMKRALKRDETELTSKSAKSKKFSDDEITDEEVVDKEEEAFAEDISDDSEGSENEKIVGKGDVTPPWEKSDSEQSESAESDSSESDDSETATPAEQSSDQPSSSATATPKKQSPRASPTKASKKLNAE